jgi:hypothetical protein
MSRRSGTLKSYRTLIFGPSNLQRPFACSIHDHSRGNFFREEPGDHVLEHKNRYLDHVLEHPDHPLAEST